jgi:hypothetical protein
MVYLNHYLVVQPVLIVVQHPQKSQSQTVLAQNFF